MIRLLVVFLVAGEPVASIEGAQPLPTMTKCAAVAEAMEPGLMVIAFAACLEAGRPVTFAVSCVDRRPAA